MSGPVRAGPRWMREALADFEDRYPDAFEALEDAIPTGMSITIYGHRGSHSGFGAVLWDNDARREVARVPSEHPTLAAACYAALHVASERAA